MARLFPQRFCRHGQAGFTLVEMMVVVAIIGVMAAIGGPAFSQMVARYELRKAASTLAERATMARMLAMNRNTPVSMTPAITGAGGFQAPLLNALTGVQLNGEIVTTTGVAAIFDPIGGAPSPPGGPATTPPSAITMNSQGLLVAAGGVANPVVWSLQNLQGDVYSVTISPGGRVRWCAQAIPPGGVCP